MLKRISAVVYFMVMITSAANAGVIGNYVNGLKLDMTQTYREGRVSAMIPLNAWHNRWTYDKEHLDKYNEDPWGFGLGLSRYEGDNWHGLYAMAFKDSNGYTETMFGYAKMFNTAIDCRGDFLIGYGYTLGLTQRHEYSYIPVPLPLPMIGVTYKRISLNAAYVPGVRNDGNVLFSWLRIDF